MIDSGLFVGTLRHRRFTPVAHAFTYPLFMALLDIDRVAELMRVSAVTSYNRWNWASFDDRDLIRAELTSDHGCRRRRQRRGDGIDRGRFERGRPRRVVSQ